MDFLILGSRNEIKILDQISHGPGYMMIFKGLILTVLSSAVRCQACSSSNGQLRAHSFSQKTSAPYRIDPCIWGLENSFGTNYCVLSPSSALELMSSVYKPYQIRSISKQNLDENKLKLNMFFLTSLNVFLCICILSYNINRVYPYYGGVQWYIHVYTFCYNLALHNYSLLLKW